MGSSMLFIISTLALVGVVTANYCSTSSVGDVRGPPFNIPVVFQEIVVPPGSIIVTFPNPCNPPSSLMGLEVTTCSDYPPAPSVQVSDLEKVYINSNNGARVDGTSYCSYLGAGKVPAYKLGGNAENILHGRGQ